MSALYPLKFHPVYQAYLWGGRRLAERFHRAVPDGVVAESWELADRDDGMSVVANGTWAGDTLRDVAGRLGAALLGSACRLEPGRFPLLIKLIDAQQRLSVQVHPDDQTAAAFGGEAKTEAWYILDAPAQATLLAGFTPGMTELMVRSALRDKRLGELLQPVPVACTPSRKAA